MNKAEIEHMLKENGIKSDGSWHTYERAKRLICKNVPDHKEYEYMIKVISNYLMI